MLLTAVALLLGSPTASAQGAVVLETSAGTASTSPDVYIITNGDTLWDISRAFMGDPYYWPRLWSYNEYITNPHWIYPGNEITFTLGSDLEPPSMSILEPDTGYVAPTPNEPSDALVCGPDIRYDEPYGASVFTTPVFLAQPEDVEVWGTLDHAKTGMYELAEGDRVYLNLDDPDAVGCGDLVMLYRQGEKVRHPESRKLRYGNLYYVTGQARVLHVDDDGVVTAVIRESYYAVHRGDLVGPSFPVEAQVSVPEPKGELDGLIVARSGQERYDLAAVGEVVFLDRGRADGVREGSSYYVVENKDRYVSLTEDTEGVSDQVIGRVVVTRVDENVSTAVVVDAASQINIGARITTQVD